MRKKEDSYVVLKTPTGIEFKIDSEDARLLTGKRVHCAGNCIRANGVSLGWVVLGINDGRRVMYRNGDSFDYRKANLEVRSDCQSLLDFVKCYVKENLGIPPTLREVCQCGYASSVSMAKRMLDELCRDGFLVRAGKGSRAYTLAQMADLVERIK